MIEEKERLTPKPLRESYLREKSGDEAVQNYRAIMNRLNEKPPKRRLQPIVCVAGAAVLVIVAATAVTQIGNYQNLKVLQQTMQALSGAVNGDDEDISSAEEDVESVTGTETDDEAAEVALSAEEDSAASEMSGDDNPESDSTADQSGSPDDAVSDAGNAAGSGTSDSADAAQSSTADAASSSGENAAVTQSPSSAEGTSSYTVKEGDSLTSISRSIYNTADMVDEICALNGIEDVDRIYAGQTLLLP